MTETNAYCGGDCKGCAIYLATREEDENKRYEMRVDISQQIENLYGQKCKLEDVGDCDGCKAANESSFSTNCKIRKCAMQKSLENCSSCDDYPCEEFEKMSEAESS